MSFKYSYEYSLKWCKLMRVLILKTYIILI